MKRIWRYFRARQFEEELVAEMRAHIDEYAEELIADGVSPDRARSLALRKFGNTTQLLESCHEKWAYISLDEIRQDLRHAARLIRRNPIFAMMAMFTLALGIGANTIIFSAVDNVLLRSLPYPQADRLYAVWSHSKPAGAAPMHVSAADFYDWQTQSRDFESLAAYASWPLNLTNVEEPRRLETQLVTANLFSTLGVPAEMGRTFSRDEDQEHSAPVMVISHHLWRTLGETPRVIGSQFTINGSPVTVIGVMPANFAFPSKETDAWVPLSMDAKNRANREGRWLSVIGRLDRNISQREAVGELDVITARLAEAFPATNAGWTASFVPLREELVGKTRPILLSLQACGLLLLVITCVNLANLLLAKGLSRAREIALRAALGAGRARIVRQLVIESMLLAVLSGIAGLVIATQGIVFLRSFGDGLIPRAETIHLSPSVALFTLGATLATAMIFGMMPAFHTSRIDLRAHLGSGNRGTSRNLERQRGLLIAIEIGLACILLISTGLLGKSLRGLLATSPGLRTDHVLTVQFTLPRSKYPTGAQQSDAFQQILQHVQDLSGVVAAAEVSDTPLKGNNPTFQFEIEGLTRKSSDAPIQAGLRVISVGYLQAAGIPVERGRDLSIDDRSSTLPVAMINETLAHLYWGGSDPLGRTLRLKEDQRWITVVGVVGDTKHMGLKESEGPVVYIPYAQKSQDWLSWTTLLVRTVGQPLTFAPTVRNAVRSFDKDQPIAEVGTLENSLSRSTAIPRFTTFTVGAISGFALLIAVVGVYGLLSYSVAQRTLELGIRLTMGASPRQVLWMLLRQVMVRVLAGVSGGLLLAWWLAHWVESLLFVVRPHDPSTYIAVALLLVLVSTAAVLVPARRAMKIDPATALRAE